MLEEEGCEVLDGVLEEDCKELAGDVLERKEFDGDVLEEGCKELGGDVLEEDSIVVEEER